RPQRRRRVEIISVVEAKCLRLLAHRRVAAGRRPVMIEEICALDEGRRGRWQRGGEAAAALCYLLAHAGYRAIRDSSEVAPNDIGRAAGAPEQNESECVKVAAAYSPTAFPLFRSVRVTQAPEGPVCDVRHVGVARELRRYSSRPCFEQRNEFIVDRLGKRAEARDQPGNEAQPADNFGSRGLRGILLAQFAGQVRELAFVEEAQVALCLGRAHRQD
ncbi:MAG: hypothetical protein JWN07_2942, partial [Hyphomicrobiales bacterium]|nr:hypothetical protein [Hyphomicrobiales bacterium]